MAIDLDMWQEKNISEIWDESLCSKYQGKKLKQALISLVKNHYEELKSKPSIYKNTKPTIKAIKPKLITEQKLA
jgi:hypothetical protein